MMKLLLLDITNNHQGHNENTSTTRNNDEITTPRCNQQMLEGNENTATSRGNIEETMTNGSASASAAPIIVEKPNGSGRNGKQTNH